MTWPWLSSLPLPLTEPEKVTTALPPSTDSQAQSSRPVPSRSELGKMSAIRSLLSTVHLSPAFGSPEAGSREPRLFQAPKFRPSVGGEPPSASAVTQPFSVRVDT